MEVTALETRYVIQCEKDDAGNWYDFGIFTEEGEAKTKIAKVREYREGKYRLIQRKIKDVLLPE